MKKRKKDHSGRSESGAGETYWRVKRNFLGEMHSGFRSTGAKNCLPLFGEDWPFQTDTLGRPKKTILHGDRIGPGRGVMGSGAGIAIRGGGAVSKWC